MDKNIESTIYKKTSDSKAIDLDEEGLIYQNNNIEKKFIANTTAMAIWDLLDGQKTSLEITQAIANACGIEPEKIEKDVYGHLVILKELGFIEEKRST